MTYDAEHRGMASVCPNCQQSIVLGARGTGRTTRNGTSGHNRKVAMWVACCALAVVAALSVFLFMHKRHTRTSSKNEIQTSAEDAVQYIQTLESQKPMKELIERFEVLPKMQGNPNVGIALMEMADRYSYIFNILTNVAPKTSEVKQVNDDVLRLVKEERERLNRMMLNMTREEISLEAARQMQTQKRLEAILLRLDDILRRANHPLSSENRLRRIQCTENIKTIFMAQTEWALKYNRSNDAVATEQDLLPFIAGRAMPKCPDGGKYTVGKVTELPKCSAPAHSN